MRHDIVAKASSPPNRPKRFIDPLNGFAVPLDQRTDRYAFALPAPQVREQPRRQPDRRLPLVFLFTAADGLPIENAGFQIDPATADSRLIQRRATNGTGAGAGIEADQKELRDVIGDGAVRLFAKLQLSHPAR